MRHLKRARQLADALKGELPHYRYIGRITKALVMMGEPEEASRIVNAIGDTNWNRKLKILIDIANAHTEIGDGRAALMALQNALQSAKTGTDRFHVLMMIANVQMKTGEPKFALSTLQQALIATKSLKEEDGEVGLLPWTGFEVGEIAKAAQSPRTSSERFNSRTRSSTPRSGVMLWPVSQQRRQRRETSWGALRTAGTIMPPDVAQGHFHGLGGKTSALLAIMWTQAKAGDISGALTTADWLGSQTERIAALTVIAMGVNQKKLPGIRPNLVPEH